MKIVDKIVEANDTDDYVAGIELSRVEEFCFFLQFFAYLAFLYARCYLCSMYRFLVEQARPVVVEMYRWPYVCRGAPAAIPRRR